MKIRKIVTIMAGTSLLVTGCAKQEKIHYPQAKTDNVTDVYFGTEVADPYRWLENDTTAEVAAWVKAENEITQNYLSKIPFRNQLKQRLTDLVNYEKISAPVKRHGKYYFSKNDGLQNQSVLYVKETLDAEPTVVLDPNKLSEDGTVALNGTSISNDGKYMAYMISRSGSDWVEIFVINLETMETLKDHIQWAKFTGAEWRGDGFYYSAYDAPEEGKEYSNVNEYHKIYYHKIGTEQKDDILVYENKQYPKRFYSAETSDDENFLFVYESGAGNGNRLFFKDLRKPNTSFIEIASNDAYAYGFLESFGDELYFSTNDGAPKYRVMKTTADKPQFANWTDVIPESENVLEGVRFIDDKMVLTYLKDAADHAYVYTRDGQLVHEVKLPTLGTVGFTGQKGEKEAFYTFTSFTYPPTIYKYDIDNNTSEKYLEPSVKFNPDEFVTEQLFFNSKDGTRIPMFIVYKKGMEKNGQNPVQIYGYGGFNISLTPTFGVSRIPFIENGGIFAMVNLRGGGEYGEEWHIAGTKMHKQNVFDDFIAAAEYLISENYTSKGHIGIMGGSNGGLLVGAVVNQRPDLYTVAVPAVGVMDMLRYHKFTIGWNWASDYGTSEDSKEMFEYLKAYSPLHNIKNDGTPYPAILITTADHDDRVVPAHSFKYAATLQASNTGDAPKLIRIDSKAGHGAGKPISKQIDEWTDYYAFTMYNLGMSMK